MEMHAGGVRPVGKMEICCSISTRTDRSVSWCHTTPLGHSVTCSRHYITRDTSEVTVEELAREFEKDVREIEQIVAGEFKVYEFTSNCVADKVAY